VPAPGSEPARVDCHRQLAIHGRPPRAPAAAACVRRLKEGRCTSPYGMRRSWSIPRTPRRRVDRLLDRQARTGRRQPDGVAGTGPGTLRAIYLAAHACLGPLGAPQCLHTLCRTASVIDSMPKQARCGRGAVRHRRRNTRSAIASIRRVINFASRRRYRKKTSSSAISR
jgi:hypothetical protein